jgi:hypothetical protein
MSIARSILSAAVLGSMLVIGCTSTTPVVEPPVESPIETVTPPAPVVDQAAIQAMGPPPGYVKPENYWVREKIIMGVASAPSAPAPTKSTATKSKKGKKRSTS